MSLRGRQWLVKQSLGDYIRAVKREASEWEFQAEKGSNLYLDIVTNMENAERMNVVKLQKSRLKKMAAWTIPKAVEMGAWVDLRAGLREKLTQLVMGWMGNWEEGDVKDNSWIPAVNNSTDTQANHWDRKY